MALNYSTGAKIKHGSTLHFVLVRGPGWESHAVIYALITQQDYVAAFSS
jgi:hypothetical protein